MFLFRNITSLSQITVTNSVKLNSLQYRELRKITRAIDQVKILSETERNVEPAIEKADKFELEDQAEDKRLKLHAVESDVGPATAPFALKTYVPTFNFAAYVNKSESLQELMKLGVDLSRIEKRKGLPQFVLKLDFETNIKPHLIFLNDLGVPAEQFGEIITKNPLIFKEDLDDLQTRINYLEAKNFQPIQIQRIVTKNPFWLMFSTKRIDSRLGYFQDSFKLTGDDVRFLAAKQPRLITYKMDHIRKSFFSIKEEMGFDIDEMKCLLLSKPKVFMMNSDELVERFDFAQRIMKLSHDMIIQFPEILISRLFRIRQRHDFLKMLGKAQYNPEKDLYVSPKSLVEGTDREFVINVAKSDMMTYDMFLRTS